MGPELSFRSDAEVAAIEWKRTTQLLPDAARMPGPVKGRGSYGFCLPTEFARLNVLPEAAAAFDWFSGSDIAWHDSVGGGCTNHLLSSQVQCVNALAPLAYDPTALAACFSSVLDIAELLPVGAPEAPEALVAFEWIPDTDLLGEWRRQPGRRGIGNTSVDAIIRFRTSSGATEVALVEWKYVENYLPCRYDDVKLQRRLSNYRMLLEDPEGPIRHDVDHAHLIAEPVYQLMRLQLLADQLERRDPSVDVARLALSAPADNHGALRALPTRLQHPTGSTFADVPSLWSSLLTRPDRFTWFDNSQLAADAAPTSPGYSERYGRRS